MFKKGSKWRLGTLGMLLALAVLGAACGKDKEAGEQAGEIDTSPAEIVIASASGWTEEAFNETFGNAIRAKFPEHTITFIQSTGRAADYYPELLTANQEVDIIWDSLAFFVSFEMESGLQYDMTELMRKHNVDISKLDESMVGGMRAISNGGLYALPVVYNTQLLYYNRDLFDRFGVNYPTDGMNWDEVLELARIMTRVDGEETFMGLSISQTQHFRQNPFSLSYIDPVSGAPTVNTRQWDPLYDVYVRLSDIPLYRDYVIQSGIPNQNMFSQRNATAMHVDLANIHLIRADFEEFNWDVVSVPTYKEKPGVHPQASPTIFGVTSTSRHKDQAMSIIQYLVSEPFQIEVAEKGTLPVMRSEAVISAYGKNTRFPDKNIGVIFSYNNAEIVPPHPHNNAVQSIYFSNLRNLLMGTIDRNTLMRTAEEEASKRLQELSEQ